MKKLLILLVFFSCRTLPDCFVRYDVTTADVCDEPLCLTSELWVKTPTGSYTAVHIEFDNASLASDSLKHLRQMQLDLMKEGIKSCKQ